MKKHKVESLWRINLLLIAAAAGFLAVFARLVFLQIFNFTFYKAIAESQHKMFQEILPERGEIFIAGKNQDDFLPIATNKKSFLFYAVPREIENKDDFIEKISAIISEEQNQDDEDLKEAKSRIEAFETKKTLAFAETAADEEETEEKSIAIVGHLTCAKELLESKLQDMSDPYEIVLEDISEENADRIKKLNLKGAYFSETIKRYYPQQEFAADVLGFVGFKNDIRAGRYGIEEFFNLELEGQPGSILGEKDTRGRWVSIGSKEIDPARNGCNIYLTIDRNIQFKAEEILKEAAVNLKIGGGSIVVIRPQTGEILAMADWPTFNPNYYEKFTNFDVFQNGAIQKIYEPGSVFKVITLSAAMNEGKISPQTKYEDKGFAAVKNRVIKNVNDKAYGIQTMTEVFEKSLNTGAIFAQQSISSEVFLSYIKKYDFGQITGIELSGEITGNIKNLEGISANTVNFATASFGQGISVTPLEMISAISAVANNGVLMKPYIVQKIEKDGNKHKKEPEEIRRVIFAETAVKISAMMVSVVRNGSGNSAAVSGYNIAGKTGTAQIPENGIYTDKSIHSFVGFGPLEDPAFAILVKFDNPQGIRFSSATAAPAFGKLAKFILEYYGITPSL